MQAAQRAPRLGSAAPPLCFPPHPSAQQGCESARREVRHPWGAPCWWLCPGHPQHCLTLSPAPAVVSPGWTWETPMLGGRALWGCPGQGTRKWRVVTLRAACLLWGFLPSLLRAFSPEGRGEGPREADLPARQRWARSALGALGALGPPAALQMAPGVLVWGRDLPEHPRGGVGGGGGRSDPPTCLFTGSDRLSRGSSARALRTACSQTAQGPSLGPAAPSLLA